MSEVQTFLDIFNRQHLASHPGIFGQCRLVEQVALKDYNKFVGNSHLHRLTKLTEDQTIWALVDKKTGALVSSLFMTYINGCMGGASPGSHHILQWSYSFTKDSPEYRRQGLNSLLRLTSMLWASKQGCRYINSVPLSGSHSRNLVESLGFTRHYDWVIEEDYYILDIKDQDALTTLVKEKLDKYKI